MRPARYYAAQSDETEQANTAPSAVTRKPMSVAERMRRMRARQREAAAFAPLMFERADWHLFLDRATPPQKAGCQRHELGRLVVKELVDNALDTGAAVTLEQALGGYIVTDDGPGIDPAEVPKLFAVNRPLLSSKLQRLPLRGMLGNGLRVVMGAIAALDGTISVASRGHCLTLAVDAVTGQTTVEKNELIPEAPGTTVTIALSVFDGTEARPARESIAVAQNGTVYAGSSQPRWYGSKALRQLFVHVVPETATVADILRAAFGMDRDDRRVARDLDQADIEALHEELRSATEPPVDIGCIGPCDWLGDHYAHAVGDAAIEGALIPFSVECWASCIRAEGRGDGDADVNLWLNRSPSLARIYGNADSDGITLRGCGLCRLVRGPKNGRYQLTVSVITPYLQLTSDGKTPALAPFERLIVDAVKKAAGAAYRAMAKPPARSRSRMPPGR